MKKIFTLIAVAVMALAAQAEVLTICDGTETNKNVPLSGFNYDLRNTMSQMIYPAEKVSDMLGGKITEVRFYATAGFNLGQNTIQLAMKDVEQLDFESVEPVTGTFIVATSSTIPGETELVFTLDDPYLYEGVNLLIETLLLSPGSFRTTYWYGMETGYPSGYYQYQFNWSSPYPYTENFLPKVTFVYEPAPRPDVTESPDIQTWTGVDGDHTLYVQIGDPELSQAIQYRYKFNDEDWTEWALYDDVLAFTEDGRYELEAIAKTPGNDWSEPSSVNFIITPRTAVTELNGDKAVASVRYFNMAGQEVAQPNGMTIVVTTFSDGSSNAVKVVK